MQELESAKILRKKGISFRLIKLSDKAISCDDVVKYAEGAVNPGEICKTIVVKDNKGNNYAFFLKGDQRVDFSKAKNLVGAKVSIISYEDLKRTTGKEPGAISPLLLQMPVFVDKKVFETDKINFGSGNHLYGLEISPKDLEKAISFKVVEVSQ